MILVSKLVSSVKSVFHELGIDIVRYQSEIPLPPDFDEAVSQTFLKVKPFTMTSPERIFALCEAVRYIVANNIPGDIVECGVWKGGSMMAVADTLLSLNQETKHLYLFDTFEGMTDPSENDLDFRGVKATKLMKEIQEKGSGWCSAQINEVKAAMNSVGYDENKIHLVEGRVEDTIPDQSPSTIALLRLDTDWYDSTRHELIHLFPRISPGGVIIIDDYGYWQGARKAVDEYIKENKISLLLNRIDFTGRIGVVSK